MRIRHEKGNLYRLSPSANGGKKAGPSKAQVQWLERGLDQPGGKLPLFDAEGKRYPKKTVEVCLAKGWAEPWCANPIKPNWQICKLTEAGRQVLEDAKL